MAGTRRFVTIVTMRTHNFIIEPSPYGGWNARSIHDDGIIRHFSDKVEAEEFLRTISGEQILPSKCAFNMDSDMANDSVTFSMKNIFGAQRRGKASQGKPEEPQEHKYFFMHTPLRDVKSMLPIIVLVAGIGIAVYFSSTFAFMAVMGCVFIFGIFTIFSSAS